MPDVDTQISDLVEQLQDRLRTLPDGMGHRRAFIGTYLRTTQAVGHAVGAGVFEDGEWLSRWGVEFARPFLSAHDADLSGAEVSRPWRLAFGAVDAHHLLVHLLLGMNAHINYDLPRAMLTVISVDDFDDPELLKRRRRDHERIDAVLAARVAAEDRELVGSRRIRDRLLTPLNRLSSQRFLREARRCVWHNVLELDAARRLGPEVYEARVSELEVLAAAKIADLLRPGQVLLRLAVVGFGVRLPPR